MANNQMSSKVIIKAGIKKKKSAPSSKGSVIFNSQADSVRRTKKMPIEEVLITKGKASDARKEKMRQDYLDQLKLICTWHPEINKYSREIAQIKTLKLMKRYFKEMNVDYVKFVKELKRVRSFPQNLVAQPLDLEEDDLLDGSPMRTKQDLQDSPLHFFATIQDGTITSTNGQRSSFNSSSTLNGMKAVHGSRSDNLVWQKHPKMRKLLSSFDQSKNRSTEFENRSTSGLFQQTMQSRQSITTQKSAQTVGEPTRRKLRKRRIRKVQGQYYVPLSPSYKQFAYGEGCDFKCWIRRALSTQLDD